MATKAKRKSRKRRGPGPAPGTAKQQPAAPATEAKPQPKADTPQSKAKLKRIEQQALREAERREKDPAPHRLDVRLGIIRPKPIWAPFPLTELATFIGIVMVVVGFILGSDAGALIGAGALICTVAITEMCLREHLAGFKSHTLLLAGVPVVALHTFIYFVIYDSWVGPPAIFTDMTVAAFLGLMLHGKWRTAHAAALQAAQRS